MSYTANKPGDAQQEANISGTRNLSQQEPHEEETTKRNIAKTTDPWWEASLKPTKLSRQQAGVVCLAKETGTSSSTAALSQAPEAPVTSQGSDTNLTKQSKNESYMMEPHLDLLQHEDHLLATVLQQEEDKRAAAAIAEQETSYTRMMLSTNTGRAFLFVGRVLKAVEQLQSTLDIHSRSQIGAIAKDDMVYLAERLLDTQESFKQTGRPYDVDLGYHNTTYSAVARIKTDGLLTRKERVEQNIHSVNRGSYYGDGVYTADNPFAFKQFGEVGLLVARIQGRPLWKGSNRIVSPEEAFGFDTVIGNKKLTPMVVWDDKCLQHEEVVLRSSSQTLPLIQFPTTVLPAVSVGSARADSPVRIFHIAIQELVDEFFNTRAGLTGSGAPSNHSAHLSEQSPSSPNLSLLQPPMPSSITASRSSSLGPASNSNEGGGSRVLNAHEALASGMRQCKSQQRQLRWVYQAPNCFDDSDTLDSISTPRKEWKPDDCPICLDPMMPLHHPNGSWYPSCSLKRCGHSLHIKCLAHCLTTSKRCPVCRTQVSKPQGCSPSGVMTITRSPSLCDGFPTVMIKYVLHGGIQKPYHDNPGASFHDDMRLAYLPDSPEGNRLLKRLIFAFRHGLTFRVGASLTTGRKDCVTWASIHHKSSVRGGVHGFPDPSYFQNCNKELDNFGVPEDPSASNYRTRDSDFLPATTLFGEHAKQEPVGGAGFTLKRCPFLEHGYDVTPCSSDVRYDKQKSQVRHKFLDHDTPSSISGTHLPVHLPPAVQYRYNLSS
jgi:deltex-like protein